MSAQCDSIDISQLKAHVLSLDANVSEPKASAMPVVGYAPELTPSSLQSVTSRVPSIARSMPDRDAWPHVKTTTELNARNISKWNRKRQDSPPSSRRTDEGEERPDRRRGAHRHSGTRLAASQPDLPSTIPESVRGKMSGPGSQSQEDTQPVSQSFHKEFSERIKQQHAAKISSLTDAISGTTEPVQHTYHQGQAGHIDLLGVFEQPTITHSQTSVQDLSDDDAEPATQVANVRADLYPESKRFQPPATPSTSSRKHNRAGEPKSNPNTTPRLPANPFAGQIGGLEGMMDASQLFKATQALSSPLLNRLPSDGMSERPSPDMHSVQRPSTADPLSSPAKLPRGNMMRSVTEPQTTYISMKDSQAERERLSRLSVAGPGAGGQETSDDDFDSEDSQVRRRRVRRKIDQETKDQFMGIAARSRLVPTVHPRSSKGKRIRRSEPNRRSSRESSDPVIISDDPPAEEIHANDTEEETEREEEQKQEDTDDEVDELADDNKENLGIKSVQVPMTESRLNYRASLPAATQSSPSSRLLGSPANARHQNTATTKKSEGLPPPSQTVAIVDSQSSQSHTKADRSKTDNTIQPRAPDSSPSPALLIPQSQPNGADLPPSRSNKPGEQACSPVADPVVPVTSHEDVESSPPKSRGSSSPIIRRTTRSDKSLSRSGKILTGAHQTANIVGSRQPALLEQQETLPPAVERAGIEKVGDQILPRESTAEEFPTSGATADAQSTEARSNGGSEKRVSHQQPSCTTIAQSTIPETSSPSEETDTREHVTTSPVKSGSTPLPDTAPVQPLDASTPFETAQTHLSSHGPEPATKKIGLRLHNSFMTSPRVSRSRTIAEIVAGPSPGTASEDVDVDINLLTSDDVEYQAVIQQLSPARKKRRGNHGRVLRVPPAPPVPSKAALTNVQEPPATSTQPSNSPPQVKNGAVEATTSKPMQDVNHGANGLTEPEAKMKASPRGRPRKIKPITTNIRSNTTNNGEQTSDITAMEPSLKEAGKPIPEEPTAQSFESAAIAPNRVFAHFNGNCAAFYPATCIGLVGGQEPRYRVRFDDGTVDVISGYGIRRLELRAGDVVKIDIGGARTKNYVVESTQDHQLPTPNADPGTPTHRGRPQVNNSTPYPQTDIYGNATVAVSMKQPRSIDIHHNNQQVHVPVKDVYLTQTLWTNFRDRDYAHPTLPDQSISRLQTPSERPSTPSTPSSRTRRINASGFSKSLSTSLFTRAVAGLFDNMAFAITNVNRVGDHTRVTQQILSNGGRILQAGFDELFRIPNLDISSPSKVSPNESRFEPTEMSMSLGFTCLIADEHCRRAKYIEALALGIPCLAPRWIQDCISKRRILPWIPYLLSSGESTYLNGAVRSRHLQPYAAETATLPSALENRAKLLDGHSVLLIMSKSEEKTMKSHPLITHALGASKVSRAINVDVAAKAIAEAQANGEPWDWVYSHDNEKEVERRLFGGGDKLGRKRKRGRERESEGVGLVAGVKGRTRVVGNEFVIQSLILGQLVDE